MTHIPRELFLVEIRDRETGNVVDVQDPSNVCQPTEPGDRCGGCYDCMSVQTDWTKFYETRIPRPKNTPKKPWRMAEDNPPAKTSLAAIRERFSKDRRDKEARALREEMEKASRIHEQTKKITPLNLKPFSNGTMEERQRNATTYFAREYQAQPTPLPTCSDCGASSRDCPECREKDGRCRECGKGFTTSGLHAREDSGRCSWCESKIRVGVMKR